MQSLRGKPDRRNRTGGGRLRPDNHRRASIYRADVVAFTIIVLATVTLRLAYVFQIRSSPYFDAPIMDARYHDEWARAILDGSPYIEGSYFRAPLYPWFLAAAYGVSGGSYLFPRIAQAVLGSLTCGLLFLIGRDAFNRKVGIAAGLAAATYWILLYYDAELLIPVLATFLDTLLVWRLLRTHRRPSPARWLVCGLLLGLSAIARPNILLLGPVLVAWRLAVEWRRWRTLVMQALGLFAGCMIPILPVTVRNYWSDGDLVLISSQGGVNFYIGNNPQSDGASVTAPGLPKNWQGLLEATREQAEAARGRPLRPSEVSRYWFSRAGRFWREQPGDAIYLTLRKLIKFWGAHEIPNFKDIDFLTRRFAPVVAYLPLGFWVIGPLGLLGIVLAWGRARELFPLWGFVIVYMISVVMFFVTARFRAPVLPVLILLATSAVFWFGRAIRSRRWPAVAGAAGILAAAALITNVLAGARARHYAYPHIDLAGALIKKERLEEAIDELHQAIRIEPDNAKAYYTLGLAWAKRGNADRAEESYRQAVSIDPDYAEAHNNLGRLLERTGNTQAAIRHFRRAIQARPDHASAHFNLARALKKRGDLADAAHHFRLGLGLAPERVDTMVQLSKLLPRLGKPGEATDLLRRAVSVEPDNIEIRLGLARILAGFPDPAIRNGPEAVKHAHRACDLTAWADPRALLVLADAYAETQRFDQAIETLHRARTALTSKPHAELRRQIARRRECFQNGRTVYESQPPSGQ